MANETQGTAETNPQEPVSPAVAKPRGGLRPEDLKGAVQVLAELVEQLEIPTPEPSVEPAAPKPSEAVSAAPEITPLPDPAPALVRSAAPADTRLYSSRLWSTIGGGVFVAVGQFAGLPFETQALIAGLVGAYLIVRTIQEISHHA